MVPAAFLHFPQPAVQFREAVHVEQSAVGRHLAGHVAGRGPRPPDRAGRAVRNRDARDPRHPHHGLEERAAHAARAAAAHARVCRSHLRGV
ncbi:hypothetical protein CBM2615_B150006 [Cupriavidus taiwanensis]|uniref:Uncharacterized protein n=1 Tax=Cupriavidus taiwanensis TaxID=164546 RepID=A0A976B091_9BURK|nr:hypothetical protein CBM2614_B160006 [Cupriavidus taiwanensis]SOZ64955.1 hypothetical protein CBM2615_B150006 [Cupriavidus taiwanensis]SOZ68700.1 hypothetical protein CBM2613_B120006 [Cupriavidus taiwanensis]SPA08092.1 hypothetical protein CBM2625_B120005 [Cupriavidus taiwanensis]